MNNLARDILNHTYLIGFVFLSPIVYLHAQSPGNVSTNLVVWLKADAGTSTTVNGADVSSWTDQSGQGNNAVTSTTGVINGNDPSYVENALNFNPGLDFDDAISENLEIAAGIFSTAAVNDINIFLILKADEIKASSVLFNTADDGSDRLNIHTPWSDNTLYWDFGNNAGAGRISFGLGQSVVENRLWSFRSSTTNGIQDVRREGDQIASDATTDTYDRGTTVGLFIGSMIQGGTTNQNFMDATLSEVIIYEGTLTTAERERIESYLAIKYGITILHDYYTSAYDGTNAVSTTLYDISNGYGNDIAGIGQDTSEGLDQPTSKSINDDAVLTVTGASDLGNSEFLMWGNDDATGTTTTGVPTGYDERLNKVWFFDETGDVGTVTMRFDLSQLGARSSNPSDYSILINNAGPTFGSVTPHTNGASISGNEITFTNVNIADGDYMTLAVSSVGGPGAISSGMALWVKPESIKTEVDGVTLDQWTDQSGNSNNLEPILLDRPLLENSSTLNNNGYLNFTADNLGQATLSSTSDASTFMAVLRSSTNGVDIFEQDNNANPRLEVESGVFQANGDATFVSTTATNAWNIVVFRNRNATNHKLFVNGLEEDSDATSITLPASGTYNLFRDYTGEVAEAIYYNDFLTANDRRQVESYLAVKYGITLDITTQDYLNGAGATILNRTNFATYSNNIAGIGKANASSGTDAQGLNQTQSQSINTTAIVSIGNASGLDDGEYLLWGSNNTTALGSISESAPSPSITGVSMTLDRKWRITETGETGTVDISIDLSSVTAVSGRELAKYTLVLDDTEDMSSPVSSIKPSSVTSNVVTFSGVDLNEGYFMVLGTDVSASPGNVSSGLALWFKAGVGVTPTTGNITSWVDQGSSRNMNSLNGDPAVSATTMNFNQAINFDGNDNVYEADSYATTNMLSGGVNTGMYTIYVVASFNPAGTGQYHFFGNGRRFRLGVENTAPLEVRIRESNTYSDVDVDVSTTLTSPTQPNLYAFKRTADNSATGATFYLNGSNIADYQTADGIDTGDNDIVIGDSRETLVTPWEGDIAEVIVFAASEDDTDRRKIETYLAIKYGITLSTNYLATDGTTPLYDVSTYPNDIAGIGRDDSELLVQSQSKSENSDAIMTIGSASDLDDSEYLVWGNDNGAVTETTTGVPSGVNDMLTRKWKAEETGEVGTVNITFDVTGIGGVGVAVTDFALIVDGDATFNDGDETIINADDFTANIVTFNSVNLSDGDIFTLATGVNTALTEISTTTGTYEVSTSCPVLSGSSYIALRDASSRLVMEINPNGNNLGATCWGVNIRNSGDNSVTVLDEDYFLDRNFYISPTTQPSSNVSVRFYILDAEIDDIRANLATDGKSNGASIAEYYQDFFRITKRDGSGLSIGGANNNAALFTPTVSDYGTSGITVEISTGSFSEFFPGTDSDNPESELPIELSYFTAKVENDQVVLYWETLTETNNDFFTIERSSDGTNFQELKRIAGAGNSTEPLDYSLFDYAPFAGLSYYRLKQTDFDGKFSYSEIVSIQYQANALSWSCYPNPTDGVINLYFNKQLDSATTLFKLNDLSGRSHSFKLNLNLNQVEVDFSHLTKGIYVLSIDSENRKHQLRLVKK